LKIKQRKKQKKGIGFFEALAKVLGDDDTAWWNIG
jgi:hypothetical protein